MYGLTIIYAPELTTYRYLITTYSGEITKSFIHIVGEDSMGDIKFMSYLKVKLNQNAN
ncbi:hypothetical protein GCM10009133_00120 [Cocleimonas flava]